MKKLFIMLAAAATVVSCAKEQTIVADQGEAIEFGNVFVDNATRVAAEDVNDPSYSTTVGKGVALTQFNVYGAVEGVNIYAGNTVTKGDAGYGAAWTVANDPGHRWITGADYKFAAVVDATSVNFDTATGMPTSLVYNVVNQKDMLYDEFVHIGLATNNPRVAFEFTHLLSKVKFSVTNDTEETATNYQYVVKDIEFTNANLTGVYAVGGTWTDTTKGVYTIDDLTVASNSTEYAANEVLLIPGVGDTDKVGMSFTIQPQMKDSKGEWHDIGSAIEFNKAVVKLEANTAYHFNVTVGLNNTIEFTATEMDEWLDGDGADDTTLTL